MNGFTFIGTCLNCGKLIPSFTHQFTFCCRKCKKEYNEKKKEKEKGQK